MKVECCPIYTSIMAHKSYMYQNALCMHFKAADPPGIVYKKILVYRLVVEKNINQITLNDLKIYKVMYCSEMLLCHNSLV